MEIPEPNFESILKSKRDYYGNTEGAIEFASEEYHRQNMLRTKSFIELLINERDLQKRSIYEEEIYKALHTNGPAKWMIIEKAPSLGPTESIKTKPNQNPITH